MKGVIEPKRKDVLYPFRQEIMPKTRATTKAVSAKKEENQVVMMASTTATGSLQVRKFDGNNFNVWRCQLEAYLMLKGCSVVLVRHRPLDLIGASEGEKEIRAQEQANYDERNCFARAVILLALQDDQAMLICNLLSAKEMWARLLEAHQQRSQGSRVVLMRQFCEAIMKDNESVVQYVSRVQQVFMQLVDAGSPVDEETLVGRIVGGLTPAYHVFMSNWGNLNVRQTIDELLPRLTAEELLVTRLKSQRSQTATSSAMTSET